MLLKNICWFSDRKQYYTKPSIVQKARVLKSLFGVCVVRSSLCDPL